VDGGKSEMDADADLVLDPARQLTVFKSILYHKQIAADLDHVCGRFGYQPA